MQIRDRIKGLRRVRAGDLRPRPRNWRKHPEAQQNALRGVPAEVGYVDAILVRELPDGALADYRRPSAGGDHAGRRGPVLVVDLTDAEADLVLATFDSLTAVADAEPETGDTRPVPIGVVQDDARRVDTLALCFSARDQRLLELVVPRRAGPGHGR